MSNAKHTNRTPQSNTYQAETSGQLFARSFLAFALFLVIAALSLTVCVRFHFMASHNVVGVFNNEKYVAALHGDITDYIKDLNQSSLFPSGITEELVTYDKVYEISNAYASGLFSETEDYNETTYETIVEKLQKEIRETADAEIESRGMAVDVAQKNGTEQYAARIGSYIKDRVEIPHIDKVKTAYNIGKTASLAAIFAFALLALILVLIILSVGNKKYRSLRSLVHALCAAATLDLLLAGGVEVIKHTKTLWVYPLYLRESIMTYVNSCVFGVTMASVTLFILAFVLMTVIWRLRRNTKK